MFSSENTGPNVIQTIRDYLFEHAWLKDDSEVSESDSLLEKGVIDSMVMVELIVFIEQTYGIHVEDDEMMPENFDSLASIAAYIGSKTAIK